jgi:hypothetical protein
VPEIRLVDLPVIRRYSLAVRQEAAAAEEVLAVLDASREAVLAALGEPAPAKARSRPKPSGAGARTAGARGPSGSAVPGRAPAGAPTSGSVAARLTPRPPGSRNPVRALAALPRQDPDATPRRRSR